MREGGGGGEGGREGEGGKERGREGRVRGRGWEGDCTYSAMLAF